MTPRAIKQVIDRYSRPDMKRIWSDDNKYQQWLNVELAVCQGWTAAGIIPLDDMKLLTKASYDPRLMEQAFDRTRHDVTAFLHSVTANLGDEGRWIHLGLTSSDVIDTALSLQILEATDIILDDLNRLAKSVAEKALYYKDTPIMGRTHGIHAEPTTFGLKMALWWDELRRHVERLKSARKGLSVGKISGAVGTHATVSPEIEKSVCENLGLEPALVSNQIIQRDRHAHMVTTLALIAASLEKFATEIRSLQRTEVREVEEPFGSGQTGSSSMPHKRNPELSERVCGLARLIRGHAITSLENVALWHERDISHSSAERLIIPDSFLALDYILDIFNGVISGLSVYPDRMWSNIESTRGLIFSQRLLLKLVEKGLSRENAYKIVQGHAMATWDHGDDFRKRVKKDINVTSKLSINELEQLFDYDYYLRHVNTIFERLNISTASQVSKATA